MLDKINFVLFLVNAIIWGITGNLAACLGWSAATLYVVKILTKNSA